jgi:hypothetical protein
LSDLGTDWSALGCLNVTTDIWIAAEALLPRG